MYLVSQNQHKVLVELPAFKRVNHRYFEAKKIVDFRDSKWVVLPFDDRTSTIFNRHGIQLPAPMEYYYTWPGRYKPFKHQIETAKFLVQNPRGFCLNSLGTGKTLAALWAADYLMSQGVHKSVLIISPLSTINSVWGDALFESMHHRTYKILHGSVAKRLQKLQEPADFYVINHDGIKIAAVCDAIAQNPNITLVILDESAVFRNQNTARYKAIYRLAGPESGRSLWSITGAPMPKSPMDIWAQARLINPASVPKYYTRLRHMLMTQVSGFKWLPKPGWEQQAYAMLKPSIRYTTEQCLDLPPITYTDHQVGMSKRQGAAYDAMVKHCVIEAEAGRVVAMNEAVKLGKLLQIATGAVYTTHKDVILLDPKPKLTALDELIEEAGGKCIVFAPYKHAIDYLLKYVKSKGHVVAQVTGDTPARQRDTIFRDFQHHELDVLIAHPQCMAHGVTLTASATIIWFAPIDNYEIYEQANARIRRAGQTQHQTIIHLRSSPVEKLVYDKLKNKEQMQGVLLDLLKRL